MDHTAKICVRAFDQGPDFARFSPIRATICYPSYYTLRFILVVCYFPCDDLARVQYGQQDNA